MVDIDGIVPDEVLRERIRQLVEPPAKPRGSKVDRVLRHPFTTLVLGFLLTAGAGKWISASIQERADEGRRSAEIREARRAAALAAVDTVGVLLNGTHYLFGEYWYAIKRDAPPDQIDSRFRLFDSARAEFESRRFIDAARVEIHLGSRLRGAYEMIADSLQHLAGSFGIARKDRSAIDEISPSVDKLRAFVSQILLDMVKAADSVSSHQ